MEKVIKQNIRVFVPAGQATIASLSTLLGQYGFSVKEFCDRFNKMSETYETGLNLSVIVIFYEDGSFNLYIKGPILSLMIKECLLEADKLTLRKLYQLAYMKGYYMEDKNLPRILRSIFGTVSAMGLVINEK